MAAVDWILLVVLAASMAIGLWRGLVFEVLSLLGWVAAFVLAQWFATDMGERLPMGGSGEAARYAAGFVIVFIVAAFAAGLVASLLRKLVTTVGLAPVDRMLGAAFGLVRGALLVLAAAVVVEMTSLHESAWWTESQAAPLLHAVLTGIKPALPETFGKFFPS